MNHAQTSPCMPAPVNGAGNWLGAHGNPSEQDRAFIALHNAYRPHGGLMRVHRPAADTTAASAGQTRVVSDLVDAGELFALWWYDALWIPMFQLHMPAVVVAAKPQRVVAELGSGFDGWALAGWFVRPNSWLADNSPIECLGSRLPAVLDAARADRFVATG